jgi:16S rRNA processing protein RimM
LQGSAILQSCNAVTPPLPDDWDRMAVVGRIARAHGIKGQVVVNPETDFPEQRFQPDAQLFTKRGAEVETIRLTSVRFQRGRPVVGIQGVNDMNAAMTWAGAELRVPVSELAPLADGMFYHHELVGCRVETAAGEDVGEVSGVEGTVGRSRLVVQTKRGEALVPLVQEICRSIDVVAKKIVIDPPEGLLELNVKDGR